MKNNLLKKLAINTKIQKVIRYCTPTDLDNKKYRNELKYYITDIQKKIIMSKLECVIPRDPNTREDGTYFIRSLYFDNHLNTSYNQVLDGISRREKYRIRYYNDDSSYIKLEKKYKINGMTNKASCRVTKEQVMDIIHNKNIEISKDNPKLLNEFYVKIISEGYRPAVIVDYERIPYIYTAGNVRITLDGNISVSYNFEEMFNNNVEKLPILEKNLSILEVKYDEFLPDHIRWMLQLNELQRTSYSKYLNGRFMINNILKKEMWNG